MMESLQSPLYPNPRCSKWHLQNCISTRDPYWKIQQLKWPGSVWASFCEAEEGASLAVFPFPELKGIQWERLGVRWFLAKYAWERVGLHLQVFSEGPGNEMESKGRGMKRLDLFKDTQREVRILWCHRMGRCHSESCGLGLREHRLHWGWQETLCREVGAVWWSIMTPHSWDDDLI